MSINVWQVVALTRETVTATLSVRKDAAGKWAAEVVRRSDGVSLGAKNGFSSQGDAMDWADDLWRSEIA